MKIETLEEQYLYVPNRKNGISLFEGNPIVTPELMEIMTEEAIEYIHNKISQIIDNRKEMFGNDTKSFYGMYYQQRFYDLKNKIIIDVEDTIMGDVYNLSLCGDYKNLQKSSNIKLYNFVKSGRVMNVN